MLITKRHVGGFTLIELVVSIFVIGVIGMVTASTMGTFAASTVVAWGEKQKLNNRAIAQSMLQYAATQSATGSLPNPYTNAGSGIYSAPLDPTNTTLAAQMQQFQVAMNEVNDDGRTAKNVRVYQGIGGLTQNVPLNVQSGPLATLTFQFGAVYSTTCAVADTACNKSPLPGASAQITSANFTTWKPTAPDFAEAYVSTLPLQRAMLAETSQRLNRVRDAMLTFFRGKQYAAAVSDATNYYPNDSGSATASASGNQGCWYSWIDLSSSSVLGQIGLSAAEYGTTAWNGRVEYCRDYDATGSGSADASPHYGAIRINKNVSTAASPDTSVSSNNIILTF